MNILQKIQVTDYRITDNGIAITYKLNDRELFLPYPAEDTERILASVGSTIGDGLSQHDALLIAAAHEEEKRAGVRRIETDNDLVAFTRNFFSMAHSSQHK